MSKIRYWKIMAVFCLFFPIMLQAQSVDERIGHAMDNQLWFQLREIYQKEGELLQTPFMRPLSEFFIAHFFNQPDSALHYGDYLLEHYQKELGGSLQSLMYFMADDAARLGLFAHAADIMHALNEALQTAGLPSNPVFEGFERQYAALHAVGGFALEKPEKTLRIPFRYYSGKRNDPVMIFTTASLNGKNMDCNYDTGAGVNVMSHQVAEELGLAFVDSAGISVDGVNLQTSLFAIVDSVVWGEIVYRNVPFQVVDFSTGHEEADAKLEEMNFQCVLGSQLMMPLNEICFDFKNCEIIVPQHPSAKPAYAPNMYRSASNMFIVSLYDERMKKDMYALWDTGAAYSGLSNGYYEKNKRLFADIVPTDSLRYAGIGGVGYIKTAYVPLKYRIGEKEAVCDSVAIALQGDIQASEYDMLFGLPTMTSFDRMTINFQNMWVMME